jgi:dTMP kinase
MHANEPKQLSGGLFIAIEGGEGAGKTSLARDIQKRLQNEKFETLVTREPGATKLGSKLRQVWLDRSLDPDDLDGIESLFLFTPALAAGKLVISDRYVFSAKAYQAADGVDESIVDQVCDIVTGGLLPTRTYWLDVTPSVGVARIAAEKRPEAPSKYDLAELEFHDRVRAGFKAQWQKLPDKITRIDADQSSSKVLDEVYDDVLQLISDKLEKPEAGRS